MKIKGAIFDLDGTILDSMHIWENVGENYLKNKGLVPEKNLNKKLKTLSLHDSSLYFREKYKVADAPDKIISDIASIVENFYVNEAVCKDGVVDFIKFLYKKGIKMCIATATDKSLALAALKRNNILDFFDNIFTCADVGCGKNKPDIFLKALTSISTDISETLVFEDAAHAAHTAKKAGFKVCAVFDKSENEVILLKNNSDFYIKTFKEASDYID